MGILAPNHVYSSGAHNADDETHDKYVPAFDDDPFFIYLLGKFLWHHKSLKFVHQHQEITFLHQFKVEDVYLLL